MIPTDLTEPEVLIGQRAFVEAQALLPEGLAPEGVGSFTVGWHDTSVQPYRGCFAVVSESEPTLAEFIGDVLRVDAFGNHVFVYVLGRADVPHPISLARRAFLGLSGLWRDDTSGVLWRMQ